MQEIDRFEHFSLTIFSISKYWNRIAAAEMSRHKLKGSYALYLVTLAEAGEPMTAAKLAEVCQRDKADVSRAITAFQNAEILQPVEKNGYRAPLILTDQGQELAAQIQKRAALALRMAGKGISDKARENMYESLDRIAENMEEIIKNGLPED